MQNDDTRITSEHRKSRSPTYRTWESLRGRCNCPTHTGYHKYGGRGIKVCERWASFARFLEDMGLRPAGMTIERKDNNGNYDPSNCKWATYVEQCRNRRSNVFIEYKGQKKSIAEWAEAVGLKMPTLWARLNAGWPLDKALKPRNL